MSLSVDQARQQFTEAVSCTLGCEPVELSEALHRTVAQDVKSTVAVPPADNSAMDGFALADSAIQTLPAKLAISQIIVAGAAAEQLKEGTAARIFTGAEIPEGANAVVIQENCDYDADYTNVTINVPVQSADNIRPTGQDVRVGDILIRQGQQLNAIDIGLLASVGASNVSVYRPLKVALLSTGDELVEPGKELKAGQIYNSNRSMLTALCKHYGYAVIDYGNVKDTLNETKQALALMAEQADIIISSGGVSVGDEDHIRPAVEQLGELEHWKVQMKPGKPVVRGKIADTPFVGLPGNPVSSYVVFQLLALPMLQRLQGQQPSPLRSYRVNAGFEKKAVTREEFIRTQLNIESGKLVAEPFNNQSSGVLNSLSWADGLVRQRIGQAIQQDDEIEFLPLSQGVL